jgi:hypothetical protein
MPRWFLMLNAGLPPTQTPPPTLHCTALHCTAQAALRCCSFQVLLLAAAISFALAVFDGGEQEGSGGFRAFVEPFVIILILILNAAVGVWQESNAENALEALKQMSADSARVFREGKMVRAGVVGGRGANACSGCVGRASVRVGGGKFELHARPPPSMAYGMYCTISPPTHPPRPPTAPPHVPPLMHPPCTYTPPPPPHNPPHPHTPRSPTFPPASSCPATSSRSA